uniref:Glutathione peroxidase n=1 Tax=Ascaris suum TaxID=6253 RepID=F1L9H1_ASCSU
MQKHTSIVSPIMSSSKQTIYDFKVKDAEGHDVSLDKYKGKVVLIVNVASKCGLASSNYAELKELLDKYADKGLVIATFPCNQFGGQEPDCEVDIRNFVKDKFKFEPDLYGKIDVNGSHADPLFAFLKKEQGGIFFDAIKWNFTKFLIDTNGRPVKRYSPTTSPKSIEKDIEALLEGKSL